MADQSSIEWTDATWQPITGCSIVSPGCTNCYAMKLAGTRLQHHPSRAGLTNESKAGPVWNGHVRFNEQWLTQPLQWKKPRRIFVCAHGDLFHENVPDEWIDKVFAVMALAPQHTFQVLTKRSARMRDYFRQIAFDSSTATEFAPRRFDQIACDLTNSPCASGYMEDVAWPLPNVWLGVSTERQEEADARIPDLLATPAAVRFISAEPLLGPIDLIATLARWQDHRPLVCAVPLGAQLLNWVIVGGESGRSARPMHPDWARALRDQCAAAGIAFFFKQWGAYLPTFPQYADEFGVEEGDMLCAGKEFPLEGVLYRSGHFYDGIEYQPHVGAGAHWMEHVGKSRAGRLLDGKTHNEMPGGANA